MKFSAGIESLEKICEDYRRRRKIYGKIDKIDENLHREQQNLHVFPDGQYLHGEDKIFTRGNPSAIARLHWHQIILSSIQVC